MSAANGGMLTVDELRTAVADGSIDTVIVGLVDMHGRLVGKRVPRASTSSPTSTHGIDVCNSLLTLDMESDTTPGLRDRERRRSATATASSTPTSRRSGGSRGTRRQRSCSVTRRGTTGATIEPSPRPVLARQVERARRARVRAGLRVGARVLRLPGDLRRGVPERLREPDRNGTVRDRRAPPRPRLRRAADRPAPAAACAAPGIPVETSKAEAWAGQHEITFHHGDPVAMADHHIVFKHGTKEIAEQSGCSITFMAKPFPSWIGSSCHVHSSLWRDGANAFEGESDAVPPLPRRPDRLPARAGGLRCADGQLVQALRGPEPTWAGNSLTWAHDNRTTGFRVDRARPEAPRRVPDPGRRLQSLPRLRGAARGGPARDRARAAASRAARGQRLRAPTSSASLRPCARPSGRSSGARSPAPPSATTSSTTT